MRLTFFSLIAFIALSSQAQTQTTPKKERIKALFVIMHQDSLIIKSIDAMSSNAVKSMSMMYKKDTSLTNYGIDLELISQKMMERSMKRSTEIALKMLNEDMVDIYDKYFTIQEIEDFITFYKSSSGQKMILKTPEITKDIVEAMSAKYQSDLIEAAMNDMEEIQAELSEQIKSKKQ